MAWLSVVMTLWSKVGSKIPLGKSSTNLIIGIALSVGLFIAYSMFQQTFYNEGYNDAVKDIKEEYNLSLERRISSLTASLELEIQREREKANVASRALQKLREAPKPIEVTEVVKIIENDSCKSLSDDFVGLLNQSYGEKP